MSDENVMVDNSAGLVNYSEDDSSSSLWSWLFVFIAIGIFMLIIYYYVLYFYDATSMEDAIEKAIKRFNEDDEKHGNTGNTAAKYESDEDEDEVSFKKVLLKALENASEEGFSNYEADTSVGTIQKRGTLNWGVIEEDKNCTLLESGQCMSGDIFPTRDISINPKLRTQ
jgi:hypothetical protein